MKTYLTFIVILILGFISTAQTSKFYTIDDAIAIKPSFTLVDFNDKSLAINNSTVTFRDFNYSQDLMKQPNGFDMSVSSIEVKRYDFHTISLKHLKKSFFRDFNMTYKRGELERLLPQSLDPSYYNPCIGGD